MKPILKYFVIPMIALLVSGMASATTLIVNCSTISGPTELVAAEIFCPQFNLSETLSNISIAVRGEINGSIVLQNGDDANQTGSGTTATSFSFGGLSGFTFVNPIVDASFTTGAQALSAGETLTVAGLAGSGTESLGNDTTVFGPYTGAGTFTIPVSTSTFFSGGGTGGFFTAGGATSANATAVVTFTYGLVPEPAAMYFIGIGLFGLGLMFRRLKLWK